MKVKSPSRAASYLTLGMVLLVATTIFAQQLAEPKSNDEKTARLVCNMIQQFHISRSKIDDQISSRLLKRFVKDLDSQKLYFTQADINEFQQLETELDDQLTEGDIGFAHSTFARFLQRLDERMLLADKLIDADHDFNIDESLATDADERSWAKSTAEMRERWRKRIKYELVSLLLEETPLDEARHQLHKRYHNIKHTMHQTEDHETLEIYLSALAHCFDPHSSYMSPQTLEDFQIAMRLRLQGIGAALRSIDGYTVVAKIVPGGAADKDGRLKVEDKIVGVGQEEGEIVDVVEMKLSKVVRFIRGDKGTIVRLKVKPADGGETSIYELTRRVIELKSAEVKGEIIRSGDRLKGTEARVGVINIPSFYRDFSAAQQGLENFKSTARDVRKVLRKFQDAGGVDVVVVDLRTNGGGALSEAIEVSGLFIDKGPVVLVKEKNGRPKPHNDDDPGMAYSGPLVVLCNRLSASASEIFAGAMKDYRRGIVVGDTTTHGKGTVQNVMPVGSRYFQFLKQPSRGALKLTINQFYRVNGDSTQNRGVRSDIVLPSILDHMDLGEAFLDNALAFHRIDAVKHDSAGQVTNDLIASLKDASRRRVGANPKFAELHEDIRKFIVRKERKSVSLNIDTLRAERKDDKKNEDEDKDHGTKPEAEDEPPVFPEGHYNDEVLQIALDYVNLLKGLKTAKN